MYRDRIKLYKKIEKIRNSKVIAYITGGGSFLSPYIASLISSLLLFFCLPTTPVVSL